MTIAIYARVSTRDKGQEVDNQLNVLRDYAKKLGSGAIEYVDQVSGAGKTRPKFEAMMADAYQRKVDMVIFWSLDRFSREGVEATLGHLKRLNDYGVSWKSYTEQYLDSTGMFKEAIIAILATIAKQEKVRIRERVLAGLDTAKAKGKQLGRPKVIFRRDEAQRMRREGKSIREIARALNTAPSTIARALGPVPQSYPAIVASEADSEPFSGIEMVA